MRKSFTAPLLVGGFLLATATQAQVHVRVGPQVGLTLATTHFTNAEYMTSYRPGVEAGVRATIGYGHMALQPAVLFSQQGYQQHTASGGGVRGEQTHRLNYLCFPLNVAYAQHAGGQGVQVSAGPYLGLLLGGHYNLQVTYANGRTTSEGQIVAGSIQPDKYPFSPYYDTDVYSRRFDAGVQAGLGYQYGGLLLQAQYGFGLRNLAAYREASATDDPAYYNRTFHLSLAYLFGPKD
jgi:hypothetical protein